MPPATTTPTAPASNWSWPSITVCMPEPHILVSVVAGTLSGRPAAIRAWRAGAWPMPAIRQQPISTSSTSLACTGVSSIAARMAAAPSRGADRPWNWPWKAPIAVRRAARMTTGSSMFNSLAARGFNGSLRCHADGAIEPDHLAIEVIVADDVAHQRGVFGGAAQSRRVRHAAAQAVLHLLWQAQQHGGLEDAGGDGQHADAVARPVARGGQGHGHHAALGSRIGSLADLPVEGRHRGGVDDHALRGMRVGVAVGRARRARGDHGRHGQPHHVEGADQVDLDGAPKAVEPVW